MINKYFQWLQKNNPTGKPDRFPELKNKYETSVPGLYCIGDLTGIPLIKFAAHSGYEVIENILKDSEFQKQKAVSGSAQLINKNSSKIPVESSLAKGYYDLIIIGAGPAGVSACLHAMQKGLKVLLLEANRLYNTINNFPAGKPIYVSPEIIPSQSLLQFGNGTKETLLVQLSTPLRGHKLPLVENCPVHRISEHEQGFEVHTENQSYRALRVIVALGKSGNTRSLGVTGENLPHVFSRLIDPADYQNKDILVVGGGDSALEAAIALAQTGNRVSLSYRKKSFSRPKENNLITLNNLVKEGKINLFLESTVLSIDEQSVQLQTGTSQIVLKNQAVFVLIGTEIPIEFLKRSKIRITGDKTHVDKLQIVALILFSAILYFGKKAPLTPIASLENFLNLPSVLIKMPWYKMLSGLLAYGSLWGLALCTVILSYYYYKNKSEYLNSPWNIFKYSYYASLGWGISALYISYKYFNIRPIFPDMGDWYTTLYSLTIVIFGLRRIHVKPTGYIKRQTWTLMAIQVIPLFILPMFLFPLLGQAGLLSDWILIHVFPGESYWRSYGLILAWPLFIHNLATGVPTTFWLTVGLLQTFVIIPYIVYKWGKGAYCGWICSCGALAETLGDEYRTLAPHGPNAKKWENLGQIVLIFSLLVTLLAWLAGAKGSTLSVFASQLYALLVDIIFAGVLGIGVYFFLSGRIWCRYLCPLAALMHIYARFSVYRIFSEKKKCISCNVCTQVCHMGIDVMNYANKGIPLNDVECVRCSACVLSCPMDVLSFGSLPKADPDNKLYKDIQNQPAQGWARGK